MSAQSTKTKKQEQKKREETKNIFCLKDRFSLGDRVKLEMGEFH
jgi:hypothetical protein